MNPGTTTTLIKDLSTVVLLKRTGVLTIIKRAKNGDYHDFKSEIPAPKVMLFRDLQLIGLDELADKAISGCYDELN